MNINWFMSAVTAPKDLWIILINWIRGGVVNVGWTILLLTILVKLVTMPLDLYVKYSTKKQTLVQQKCAPQVAKLQKKYGNDQQTLRMQTNALYKREGFSVGSGCIMIINLLLTLVIFFTFYSSLRKFSAYEAINQYEQIETTYESEYYLAMTELDSTKFTSVEVAKEWNDKLDRLSNIKEEDRTAEEQSDYDAIKAYLDANETLFITATNRASEKAVEKWNEIKSDWLWIQNIWVADSSAKPFPTYSSLQSMAKSTGYTGYVNDNIDEKSYNSISAIIVDNSPRANNGFFILAVLAGVITFLSQYIAELHNKLKSKKANEVAKTAGTNNAQSMKFLKILMPVIMVIFVLTTSASFGIYILASNIASIAFGEIVTLIVDKKTQKQRLEVEEYLEKEANRMIKKGQLKE